MATSEATHRAIDAVWRIEAAKVIAGVARMVRDVGLAEELAQDALVAALEHWPDDGVPDNPGAWLMRTAKNRALDRLRQEALHARKHEELGADLRRCRRTSSRTSSTRSPRRAPTTSATTCCAWCSPPATRSCPPRAGWRSPCACSAACPPTRSPGRSSCRRRPSPSASSARSAPSRRPRCRSRCPMRASAHRGCRRCSRSST